jgi:hypothetical protein
VMTRRLVQKLTTLVALPANQRLPCRPIRGCLGTRRKASTDGYKVEILKRREYAMLYVGSDQAEVCPPPPPPCRSYL